MLFNHFIYVVASSNEKKKTLVIVVSFVKCVYPSQMIRLVPSSNLKEIVEYYNFSCLGVLC